MAMAKLVCTHVLEPNAWVFVVPLLCIAVANVFFWICLAVGANAKKIVQKKDRTKKITTTAAVQMALYFYSLRAQSWQL